MGQKECECKTANNENSHVRHHAMGFIPTGNGGHGAAAVFRVVAHRGDDVHLKERKREREKEGKRERGKERQTRERGKEGK